MFGAQVSSRVTPVKARRDGGLYDNADVMKNIGAVVGIIYLQRQKLSARGYTVPVYIYIYMLQQREEHPAANLVMCLDQTPSCLSDHLICSTEVSPPAVCLQRVPERFHILKLPGNF